MATRVTFINNIDKYRAYSTKQCDTAFEGMALEIVDNARKKVPLKTGDLAATVSHKQNKPGSWIAAAGKSYYNTREVPYARRREYEEGVKFTTPGTGAHYLEDSANAVFLKIGTYFKATLGRGKI